MEINQELIAKVADYFTIVHHTPGRIRLRASPALKKETHADTQDIQKIINILKNIPIIQNIKLNILIGSVTLHYDSKQFDSTLWEAWIKKERLNEILTQIQHLTKGLQND